MNGSFGLSDLSNDDASDNLQVECRHVDGTMNAAVRAREMDWLTEGAGTDEEPVCRILTNACCLSEGVDVPTLDAVLFLSPRNSQVDVIQAVGRVMRRAEGEDFGYIILPVAVPAGMAPERALDDNKRFQVVWQVLKALRAHDERLDAAINSIATVINCYIRLINQLLEDPQRQSAFQDFVKALQTTLNPAVDRNAAVEMLASHSMFENERASLDVFYQAMIECIEAVHTLADKQDIMRTLYDRFFSQAFPSMSERLCIVFTPVEVVDFIIRSANDAMDTAFKQTLANPGVAIIEPFAGTGTFVARLLQLGVIPAEALERKYLQEIFANEVVLLSYYIASVNIEQVYHQVRAEQGVDEGYVEFPGMTLTDTFQLHEGDGTITEDFEGLAANNGRAKAEKDSAITVIVMKRSTRQLIQNDGVRGFALAA